MKKFVAALLAALCTAGAVFAQELQISGEIKTGFFWYQKQIGDAEPKSEGFVHNSEDDSGEQLLLNPENKSQGRFRLNLQIDKENVGMKVRFQQLEWRDSAVPQWNYAFAYGDFLNDQLKISVGKLGDSPWATGGPEMWKELDTRIGIRTEIKPSFVPGLNIGFVLNDMDDQATQSGRQQTIGDILMESVLGLSYINDYFAVRLAYRLDSECDYSDGDRMIFRLEEKVIQQYLPGFQIWANGSYEGIRSISDKSLWLVNWLYIQYAPEICTAQLRLGYDALSQRSIFYARPSFYYNFFDKFLNVGASFEFAQDFGDGRVYKNAPYLRMVVEPMIKINFGSAYAALVYQYRNEYHTMGKDEITRVHAVNLRTVFTF
jgi:hypothetical protein